MPGHENATSLKHLTTRILCRKFATSTVLTYVRATANRILHVLYLSPRQNTWLQHVVPVITSRIGRHSSEEIRFSCLAVMRDQRMSIEEQVWVGWANTENAGHDEGIPWAGWCSLRWSGLHGRCYYREYWPAVHPTTWPQQTDTPGIGTSRQHQYVGHHIAERCGLRGGCGIALLS